MFYVDKDAEAWLPERLVDWLRDYDCLLSSDGVTIFSKLAALPDKLAGIQVFEDESEYWECISHALAVGWLDVVVELLRSHGSYQLYQLGNREMENGLVEAVAVLVLTMPRLRPTLADGKIGQSFASKPDFIKAWEIWRAQVTKLQSSTFWLQCDHSMTRDALRNLLQIMLGNVDSLVTTTCHWMELYVAHFIHVRPFTVQWEGLIELLGVESGIPCGLDFLRKYRDFKRSLQNIHSGKDNDAARQAVECLILLMKNRATPFHFWLPLLYDSLKLLNWRDRPLLNASETNLMLNKLQELSMARLRPDFYETELPSHALSAARLALAYNLGRAIIYE